MHIALVTGEFAEEPNASGGLAAAVERTALALTRDGQRVSVIVCSQRDRQEMRDGYRVLRVRMARTKAWNIVDRITARRFATGIDARCTGLRIAESIHDLHTRDRIHVMQYPNLGGFALWAPDLPLVVRCSSHRRLWHEAGDGELSWWHMHLLHRLEITALRHADLVFAPSRLIATITSTESGRRVLTIPTIAMTSMPEISHDQDAGAKGPLLIVGTRSRLKGTALLAATLPDLLSEHPDMQVECIGRSVDDDAVKMLHTVRDEWPHRISLHNPLPRANVLTAMARSRVLVIPSLIDNLPNVLIEGLAAGAIVVATTMAGADQLIDDGHTGFLVPTANPDDLRRAITRAWSLTPTERSRIRHAAQARIAAQRDSAKLLRAAYLCAIDHHRTRHHIQR